MHLIVRPDHNYNTAAGAASRQALNCVLVYVWERSLEEDESCEVEGLGAAVGNRCLHAHQLLSDTRRYGINHSFAFDAVAFQPHLATSFICSYFSHVLVGQSPWDRARRMLLRRSADLAQHATVIFMGRPTLTGETSQFVLERWVWASMNTRPWGITLPFHCGSTPDGKNELGDDRPEAKCGLRSDFCTTLESFKRLQSSDVADYHVDKAFYRCKYKECKATIDVPRPTYFLLDNVVVKDDEGFWYWYELEL